MNFKAKDRDKMTKSLAIGIILSNIPACSFATTLKENPYNQEIVKTFQESAQKAVKSGELEEWLAGLANMPTKRADTVSSVINGKIYVIGGMGKDGPLVGGKVEVYDPIANTWETKTSMPTKRYGATASVVDGKIYVIGGWYSNVVEVYDPATDTWETKANMTTDRAVSASSVVNGKIYVIGGYNDYGMSNSVEEYNPATDTWETKANMPTAKRELTSSVVNGKIYTMGGFSGSKVGGVEEYDPVTDTWKVKSDMPTPRFKLTSSVVDGKIYAIGGEGSDLNLRATVEMYDPITDSWISKKDMPTARSGLTSGVIDGKIYAIGGNGGKTPDSALDTVEAMVPYSMPVMEKKNASSNVDIYIKSENLLSLSVDTNNITFEDFSGVEDMEKLNAINITINSSLPYRLNAYLPTEIQNSDKSKVMDKSILNIKESSQSDYKVFSNLNEKLILKDNNSGGNNVSHKIDIKLKGGIAYEPDVYKATIKFETEQI